MARRIRITALVLTATVGMLGLTGNASAKSAPQVVAKSAKITARIQGAPTGAKLLAVTSTGSSSFANIINGQVTITLPRSKASTVKFSLHLVTKKKSYAGSISIGKVDAGKTKWYANATVINGTEVTIPKITFNSAQKWGSVTFAANTLAIPSTALKGASALGKPKFAGRLGLGQRSRATSASAVHAASLHAFEIDQPTGPGEDLDADGLPNSLDIDDNGNGLADTVDPNTSSASDRPTTTYDAFSSLGSGWGTSVSGFANPNNFNLMDPTLTTDELRKELSILADANFRMTIRAVAPFFTTSQDTYIKAAWVNCQGLAWCIAEDDLSDPDNPVYAPRMLSTGDGDAENIWKYAFAPEGAAPCNVHDASGDSACNENLWGSFSMKQFLTNAKNNGYSGSRALTDTIINDIVGAQGTPGFGLMDSYVLYGTNTGSNNRTGFDLSADINPHGGVKFLDNIKTGDVFTINALLSDGTTSSIAMTIAPYFITAPTVVNYTPGGGVQTDVLYDQPDPFCAVHDNRDCRPGSEGNPFTISASDPTLDLTFWRPQRLRIPGVDDAIGGGAPLVDMGGLDYRVSVQGGDGSPFIRCPNDAVQFTNGGSESSIAWTEVIPTDGLSNSFEYMKDPTADAKAESTRTVTLSIDFSGCTGLSHAASSTKYNIRFEADSQPTFGGQRGSTMQTFYFKFQ